MNGSEKLNEIAPALVAAQEKLKNPKTDSRADTGKFSYQYLSLPALTDAVRTAFRQLGLAFVQEVTGEDGGIRVVTRIMHLSGQWIDAGPLYLPCRGGPQDYGSAITYGRRYSLAAAVGLAAEEDDDAGRPQASTKRRAAVDSAPTPAAPSTAGPGGGEDAAQPTANGAPPLAGDCDHDWKVQPSGRSRICTKCMTKEEIEPVSA